MPHKKMNKTKGSLKQKKKSIRKNKASQKKVQKKNQKKDQKKTQKKVHQSEDNKTIVVSEQKGEPTKQLDKNCCMCMQPIENKFFNPSKCMQQHGSRAHRICSECWWGEFAKEGTNHICPGCEKNMPLPPKNTEKNKPGATIILVDE